MQKVLIIDNNPEQWAKFSAKLYLAGYSCFVVVDAEDALAKMESAHFDLLLVDLLLPGEMNGLGLIEQIRLKWSAIPLLAYSSVESRPLHEKALRAGADAFTTKERLSAHPEETIEALLVGSSDKAPRPCPAPEVISTEPTSMSSAPSPASAKLFAGLPRTALHELYKIARPVNLLPGERCEVREEQEMAVLLSGAAMLYFNDRTIASALPGDCIGNYSFFLAKSKPFTFVCEAQTASRLYKFEKTALKRYFCSQNENIRMQFVANMVTLLSEQLVQNLERSLTNRPEGPAAGSLAEKLVPIRLEIETN